MKPATVAREPLTTEHVDIDSLRPNPANPRRISDSELESLTRSIREFGLVDPVIARHDERMVRPNVASCVCSGANSHFGSTTRSLGRQQTQREEEE